TDADEKPRGADAHHFPRKLRGDPDVGRGRRKRAWHHADDRVARAADDQSRANGARTPRESPRPESLADHHGGVATEPLFLRDERPAEQRSEEHTSELQSHSDLV